MKTSAAMLKSIVGIGGSSGFRARLRPTFICLPSIQESFAVLFCILTRYPSIAMDVAEYYQNLTCLSAAKFVLSLHAAS